MSKHFFATPCTQTAAWTAARTSSEEFVWGEQEGANAAGE